MPVPRQKRSLPLARRDRQPLGAEEMEFSLSDPQKDRGCENLLPEDACDNFTATRLLLHNEIVPLNVQESVGAPGFFSPRQKSTAKLFP